MKKSSYLLKKQGKDPHCDHPSFPHQTKQIL